MDHCLTFTGGFGDPPYLSTIPFRLQLLNLQDFRAFIFLSWKYSRTKYNLGNGWDGLISTLIAAASILLCFPENPTGFSANLLLFLQRKSCCNATVFPSYVGAPAVFLSSVSFYSEIFRRLEFSTLWVTLKSCLEWRSENRRSLILLQKN